MPLVNCQKCGKAFLSKGGRPICPECRESEGADFEKVREFVKDNPKMSIDIVSEETGVPTEKIRQYLQDGLLEQAETTKDFKCQLCGKSINSGNYCFTCMNKLKKGFDKGSSKKEKKKETTSFTQDYLDKKR
jgi:hypothetical protein